MGILSIAQALEAARAVSHLCLLVRMQRLAKVLLQRLSTLCSRKRRWYDRVHVKQ